MEGSQPRRRHRFAAKACTALLIWAALAMVVSPLGADETATSKMYAQRSAKKSSKKSTKASAGTGGDDKKVEATTMALESASEESEGLEIRGQTRTLSMMLVLQNRRDKIDFIKPRRDYRDRILQTEY